MTFGCTDGISLEVRGGGWFVQRRPARGQVGRRGLLERHQLLEQRPRGVLRRAAKRTLSAAASESKFAPAICVAANGVRYELHEVRGRNESRDVSEGRRID